MAIDFNQLRELLAAIASTDIAELTLKSDDFELTVRKAVGLTPTSDSAQRANGGIAAPIPPAQIPALPNPTPEAPASGAAAPTSPPIDKKWVEIKSPMVGTFYRAPGPDDPPFVDVGDRIRVNQAVCIIEAMKLMNEIEAEVSGQVMEILVQNGAPVEYGQPLMRVNPEQ